MSPLIFEIVLAEKYGPRLTMQELAEVLKINLKNLQNRLAQKSINIPTYKDGVRYCLVPDVVKYILDNTKMYKDEV